MAWNSCYAAARIEDSKVNSIASWNRLRAKLHKQPPGPGASWFTYLLLLSGTSDRQRLVNMGELGAPERHGRVSHQVSLVVQILVHLA